MWLNSKQCVRLTYTQCAYDLCNVAFDTLHQCTTFRCSIYISHCKGQSQSLTRAFDMHDLKFVMAACCIVEQNKDYYIMILRVF